MENNLLTIDFGLFNDLSNWNKSQSATITQNENYLSLEIGSANNFCERSVNVATGNDSDFFRMQINGRIRKKRGSNFSNLKYIFEIVSGGVVLFSEITDIVYLKDAEDYVFYFDRSFPLKSKINNFQFVIRSTNGFENYILLENISFKDYKKDLSSIRSYFVLDNIFETAFKNINDFGALIFKEYTINDRETLTSEFVSENNINIGGPLSGWLFSRAKLDNSEREANLINPNSFNPFYSNQKLIFQNPYNSKTAVSSQSGSYYGLGMSKIGVDLPYIYNKDLEPKKAPFFVDIDYTKDLKINFEIFISKNQNIYSDPYINRDYFLIWDSFKCEARFYYYDKLNNDSFNDQIKNGFLNGISAPEGLEIPSQVSEFTRIFWTDNNGTENREGYLKNISVSYFELNYPVNEIMFQTSENGVDYIDTNFSANVVNFDLLVGYNYIRLRAVNNLGLTVYSNVLQYKRANLGQTSDYYFQSIFECSDPINNPNLVSYVDYIDSEGNQKRDFIGCDPCKLIRASVIIATNGVKVCVPRKCMEYYYSVPSASGEYYHISGTDCNGQPFEMEFGGNGQNAGGSGRFCALSASGGGGNGYVYEQRECATVRP